MANIRELILNMKLDAQSDASRILHMISDISEINLLKNAKHKCFTMEIIENIDCFTMKELSEGFNEPINLPDRAHPLPWIRVAFTWGSFMLLQQSATN